MSGGALRPIESVTGGSHGVRAGYEQMRALAARFERQAGDLAEMAGLGARVMTDGDLLESSVLSPLTFADAQVQVLDATAGADGLTVRAVGIEADALGVRAVVAAFEASDALAWHLGETIDSTLGRVTGRVLAPALPALLVAGGLSYAWWSTLSAEEQAALGDDLADDLGRLVHDHPELAQHLVNSGGGLVDGLTGGLLTGTGMLDGGGPIERASTNDAARLMALLLGNDTGFAVERIDGVDPLPGQLRAPGSLEDLMLSLDQIDPDRHGAIQVQRIVDDRGERSVVYLPGTDDMSPVPRDGGPVRDMETNYQLIGGLDSAYGRGIQQAMLDAGLEGHDVMLVGHSQGGMVATALAADPGFTRHFDVQHVVTAGSPTAQVPDLPAGTSAIHLENRGDAVPLLDGEDTADQPHRTTVRFDDGGHDVVDNHALDHYISGAAAADASTNGSIRDQVQRMRDDGFLGNGTVEGVATYRITRR
ncbi:MAG TPA: hypothetical protein VLA70_04095 [Nocardioides sp.]|nr:hypothetical protein [Nocardioides sp.]